MISHGWDELFLDLDPERGLKAGERWQGALKQAAERCELVIFIVSPIWASSKWCLAEFLLAANLNKRIIGVIVEPTPFEDLPTELTAEWQLVDLTAGVRDHTANVTLPPGDKTATVTFSGEGLNRLRIGMMQSGLDPSFFAWPPKHDPERAPYRGLHPLEAEDAGIFFGRDGPIVVGNDMLRGLKEGPPPRLAVILGASGSGKSSFMRAGLLPRLAREEQHFLPLPVIRPERAAISGESGLVACMEEALRNAGLARKRADVREAIDAGASGLASLLAALVNARTAGPPMVGSAARKPPNLILPIDQAEELFHADGGEEADAFLRILRDLTASDKPALIALFTIRSDHYELLQTAKALEGVRQQFLSLPPMPQGSFAEIIKGPAARLEGSDRKLAIEDPLVDVLLADVEAGGAKDALPLLAFTLERLYREHGGGGELKVDDYHRLGGIKGAIEAAVEHALHLADANLAIPRDRKARLSLLRRSLVPWLAGIDPDTGAPRRRVARLSEIPTEALPLLDLLVEQRLLATDVSKDTGEVTIEPTHEALLRQWDLLKGWLEEDFEDLATLEGIKRAARDWSANARDDEWVTHASGRLEAAEHVTAREDFADVLDPTERAYLAAARIAEDARKQSEYALLQRDRRRSRIIAFGATAAALTMGVLGWVMYGQWQDALRTESRFLADLSFQKIKEGDAVTGLLLALEALNDDNSDRLSQSLRPYVPAAQGALDAATSQGTWHDKLLTGHSQGVTSVAVTADGARILTGSLDKTARLWDAVSGDLIAEFRGHTDRISAVAVTPDGRRIATGSDDGTARLWDTASGRLVAEFNGHTGRVLGVAVSADGTRIITGSDDHTARIWDAASGAPVAVLKGHRSAVSSVAVTPDGTRIVTGSWDRTARLWDAATEMPTAEFKGHAGAIRSIAVSADGTRIVTGSRDKSARLWDAATGALVVELKGHTDAVFGVAITPDGRRVVTGSWDKTARLWDAVTGTLIVVLKGHSGVIRSVAVSADGMRIVTGSWDDTTRIWDVAGSKQIAELKGNSGAVSGVVVTSDGRQVITGSEDGTVQIWDAASGHLVRIVKLMGDTGTVRSAAVTPDGGRIVTGSSDNTARLWDAVSGQLVAEFKGHTGAVGSVAVTPDGRRIATGSDDGTLRLWDAASGKQVVHFGVNTGVVYSIAMTADGGRIVTGADDKTARLWDAASGQLFTELKGHTDAVFSVAMTPDGKRIVTGSKDKTIRLWDTGGDHVQGSELMSGTDPVLIVAITPDGRQILSGSDDGTVRILDAASGQQVAELKGHSDAIRSVAFSPDGSRIITGSEDGTARIWGAPPPAQTMIDRSKDSVSRCLTHAQRKQFHLAEAAPRWCYDKKKWPYSNPKLMPPPSWYELPFVDAVQWVVARRDANSRTP
jgi:WD40 repeat protein